MAWVNILRLLRCFWAFLINNLRFPRKSSIGMENTLPVAGELKVGTQPEAALTRLRSNTGHDLDQVKRQRRMAIIPLQPEVYLQGILEPNTPDLVGGEVTSCRPRVNPEFSSELVVDGVVIGTTSTKTPRRDTHGWTSPKSRSPIFLLKRGFLLCSREEIPMDVELGLVRQGRKSPPIFIKARRFRSASRPEIQEPTSKASKSECYPNNAHSAISGFLWDVPSAMVMAPVPLPTFTSTPPQTRIPSNKRINPVNNPNVYPDMFAMDADAFDESLHFPLSYALGGPTMDESEAEVGMMAGESAVVVSAGHKTLRPSGRASQRHLP